MAQLPRFRIPSRSSSRFASSEDQDRQSAEWRENLWRSVKINDYSTAEKIYLQILGEEEALISQSRAPLIHQMYELFLTVCNEKTHLSHVNHVLKFFEIHNFPITEECYFALIRCYGDMGDDKKMIEVIQTMKDKKLELQYRHFQPLFDVYLRKRSISGFLTALNLLIENHFTLKSKELSLLLKAIDRERRISRYDSFQNDQFKEQLTKINEVILKLSDNLLGMDSSDMIDVIEQFTDYSSEQVIADGILVRSKENLSGPVSISEKYEEDGSFSALTALRL